MAFLRVSPQLGYLPLGTEGAFICDRCARFRLLLVRMLGWPVIVAAIVLMGILFGLSNNSHVALPMVVSFYLLVAGVVAVLLYGKPRQFLLEELAWKARREDLERQTGVRGLIGQPASHGEALGWKMEPLEMREAVLARFALGPALERLRDLRKGIGGFSVFKRDKLVTEVPVETLRLPAKVTDAIAVIQANLSKLQTGGGLKDAEASLEEELNHLQAVHRLAARLIRRTGLTLDGQEQDSSASLYDLLAAIRSLTNLRKQRYVGAPGVREVWQAYASELGLMAALLMMLHDSWMTTKFLGWDRDESSWRPLLALLQSGVLSSRCGIETGRATDERYYGHGFPQFLEELRNLLPRLKGQFTGLDDEEKRKGYLWVGSAYVDALDAIVRAVQLSKGNPQARRTYLTGLIDIHHLALGLRSLHPEPHLELDEMTARVVRALEQYSKDASAPEAELIQSRIAVLQRPAR